MNSESYFFYIITATRNAAKTIPDLAASLASQTCRDFIWILQDGMSFDSTVDTLESWRQKIPALSIECAYDHGIYDAWNKALDRTQIPSDAWVLFLGADDVLAAPYVLEQAKYHLESMPSHVLYASAGAHLVGHAHTEVILGNASNVCARLRTEMPFCHTALFHRATIFTSTRFDITYRILGDYDFLCRTLSADFQVCTLPHINTHMRRGGISTKLCMQPAIFKEACRIAFRYFGRLYPYHVHIGIKVLTVALLCTIFGEKKAERIVDAIRMLRGKHPAWRIPPTVGKFLCAQECAVILVHYNNASDTLACLRSLRDLNTPPAHILVVDNHSCQKELDALRNGWCQLCGEEDGFEESTSEVMDAVVPLPSRLLLTLPQNAGFAGGNNAALCLIQRNTCDKAVWLLNNDTEVDPAALDALCARLNIKPDAGACGATIVYADNPNKVQSAGGGYCCLWTGQTRSFGEGQSLTYIISLSERDVAEKESDLQYLSGASCLVRRETLEQVGLLPEDYFLYYEDVLFSWNILQTGFSLAWAKDSIVFHKEGGSTKANAFYKPVAIDYLSIRNRVALIRQCRPWALSVTLASMVGVCYRRLRRGQVDRLKVIAKAIWDGLCGRMGPPLF